MGFPPQGSGGVGTTVEESELNLTDVTTANATTSLHGFLLKLDNTATNFMDGTGSWSAPAGGKIIVTAAAKNPKSSQFTTTSTTYVDITDLTTTIITSVTSTIIAWTNGTVREATGGVFITFLLMIDGTGSGEIGCNTASSADDIPYTIFGQKTGVAAATITVKQQVKTASGTAETQSNSLNNIFILAREE